MNKLGDFLYEKCTVNPHRISGFILVIVLVIIASFMHINPIYIVAILSGWVLGDFWKLCDNVYNIKKIISTSNTEERKKTILND